jgi:hypothetical protein
MAIQGGSGKQGDPPEQKKESSKANMEEGKGRPHIRKYRQIRVISVSIPPGLYAHREKV